jgi:type IV secretion system protein VirD4
MVQFVNPFRITDAPDHMTEERQLRHKHIYHTIILCFVSGAIAAYATPLVMWIMYRHLPLNAETLADIGAYFAQLFGPDPLAPHRAMINDPWFVPGFLSTVVPGQDDPQIRIIIAYVTVVGITVIAAGCRQLTNPHRRMVMKADASWCTPAILRRMEARGQVGIKNGFLMSLGKWPTGLRAGQDVRMIETLSALLVAPPGTGKTAGFAVPSIVSCDKVSFVVNDRKPEIYEMTGAWRGSVSHNIVIDWSKIDKHNLLEDAETHEKILDANGQPKVTHEFYARFNPLSPKMMPPPGPDRDTYISTVAAVLVPKNDSKGGSSDSYFADKGRDALTGMIHATVARVTDRDDTDPKKYEGMPKHWHGKEASLPMLTDWIAHSQFAATADESADPFKPEPDPNANAERDRVGTWFRNLCDEINPENKLDDNLKGTTARGFNALSQLVNMADRERSGVLGTMDQALQPFKNASVKERTSSSDFTPDDLRGIKGPDGVWKPVTLYVCVNQAEADAFATITALLFEVLSRSLLTYKPNDYNPRTKRQLGPFAVNFMLDEFAKLPRIPAVLEGPDTGRSMGVSYSLICQSYGQIEKIYGDADVKIIDTTTSCKIILPQNEIGTIERFQKMVGKTSIRRAAHSFHEGMGKTAEPFKWQRSDTTEETDFLRVEDLSAMPQGTHLLLVQEFINRPMKLKTALFFKDDELKKKVRSRGTGPIATKIIPDHVLAQRIAEYNSNIIANDKLRAARLAHAQDRAITKKDQVEHIV